jgi:hypothetical protein
MFRGEIMAGIIKDEVMTDPSPGFVGGYYMETLVLGPAFLSALIEPDAWGADFTKMMDAYSNMAGMWIVGEDMPQATNRITLSDFGRDQWDLPMANVHFDDHPNYVAMLTYAYEKAEELYKAVGAVGTHWTPPYP